MTAYPTLDEKFTEAQRDRLRSLGVPIEAVDRIQYEVMDLKSSRYFNAPPSRSEKIREIGAFLQALADFREVSSSLSNETLQMIRAHSFGEGRSAKTGNQKTRTSPEEFVTAYQAGATEAMALLNVGGKARDDEPEVQRKIAVRILRVFEEFRLPIEPNLKRAFVTAIDIACEVLGLAGGSKVGYAKYAIEKTSS